MRTAAHVGVHEGRMLRVIESGENIRVHVVDETRFQGFPRSSLRELRGDGELFLPMLKSGGGCRGGGSSGSPAPTSTSMWIIPEPCGRTCSPQRRARQRRHAARADQRAGATFQRDAARPARLRKRLCAGDAARARRGARRLTIADLARHAGEVTFGTDLEFLSRPEWTAFRNAYGLNFKAQRSYTPTFMYRAVDSGDVDIITAFSSDGRIAAQGLVVLDDPAHAIPAYDAVLLSRRGAPRTSSWAARSSR